MKFLFAVFTAVILCLPSATWAADPTPAETSAQQIRLPKVEFRDASLKEAISFLNKKSIECDGQKKGVNIAIAGAVPSEDKITISVNDATVYDILNVVAAQVGMQIEPSPTILMLVPKAK